MRGAESNYIFGFEEHLVTLKEIYLTQRTVQYMSTAVHQENISHKYILFSLWCRNKQVITVTLKQLHYIEYIYDYYLHATNMHEEYEHKYC